VVQNLLSGAQAVTLIPKNGGATSQSGVRKSSQPVKKLMSKSFSMQFPSPAAEALQNDGSASSLNKLSFSFHLSGIVAVSELLGPRISTE
jgi:hypothetical protein